jgi:hypothetical protein
MMKAIRLVALWLALPMLLLLGTAGNLPAAMPSDDAIPGFGSAAAPTTTRRIDSITTPDFIRVQSGEQIDCGGSKITYSGRGGFLIQDAHDVVIQNCRFESTLTQIPTQIGGKPVTRTDSMCKRALIPYDVFGCGVAIFIRGNSYNIAIVHNAFTHCGEKCVGGWSIGLERDANGKAPTPDRITIAYNDFSDSYFGGGFGETASIEDSGLADNERTTFAFNRCDGVFRRCLRFASHAVGDETNNVIRHWVWDGSDCGGRRGFGPSTTGGAHLLLRANVYDAAGSCPRVVDISSYRNASSYGEGRGIGFVRMDPQYPDLLKNGAEEEPEQSDTATIDVPSYPVLPASEVEAYVNAHVGPKPGK